MVSKVTFTKISIENYRSCIKTEFTLRPDLSVFIGPNGSGKTNILAALQLLNKLVEDDRVYLGSGEMPTSESEIDTAFEIEGKRGKFHASIGSYTDERNNDVVINADEYWYLWDFTGSRKRVRVPMAIAQYLVGEQAMRRRLTKYRYERFLLQERGMTLKDISPGISAPISRVARFVDEMRYYSASQFTNPSRCPVSFEIEQDGIRRRATRLSGHAKFLFDLYSQWKSGKPSYAEFVDIVTSSGIGLVDEISFKELETSSIDYAVRAGGTVNQHKKVKKLIVPQFSIGSHLLSPNQLSEGTFKTITLLFYLITESSTLLLIEEPEVCVHHGLLNSIISLIKTYSEQKQIAISTHSDFVLDQVAPENVYKVQRDNDAGTEVHHVPSSMSSNEFDALKDYLRTEGNLGEYWRHGGID